MPKTYGTHTNAIIEKTLEVTQAKTKIRVTADIWKDTASKECYISLWDSTNTIIPMTEPTWGSPYGCYLHFVSGISHLVLDMDRTSGIPYTIGELLTIRFKTPPWDTGINMYFYEIKLEMVD